MSVEPGLYKHHKGNFYEVLMVGKHSETGEELVVYKALYDHPVHGYGAIWIRPIGMWSEEVRPGVLRFEKVEDVQK